MIRLTRLLGLVAVVLPLFPVHAGELLIENATIYTLSDEGTIENGFVLIADGKIKQVGQHRNFDFDGRTIDASGKTVTPGLINSYTHLGLVEIDAVSQSVDFRTEDLLFGPSFTIAPAINPASTLLPQNKINGLTHAIVVPEPGHQLFAGYGAAIHLGSIDSMIIDDKLALFVNFAAEGSLLSGGSRAAAYAKMRRSFLDAQEYRRHKDKIRSGNWREYFLPLHDLEALVPVLNGDKALVVTAHRASDIRLLLKIQKEFGFRMVVAGASEAWLLAQELAAANVPIIMDPMANLPLDFDQLATRLDAAARLHAAGVTLLFTYGGVPSGNTHSAYLVRQAAGNAAAYGLPVEEAIKAMTLNPAEVFGFAGSSGSIAAGKEADLVIWDGHPLELLTRADSVIIAGEEIPMISRATRLRDRYRNLDTAYPPAYQK